MKGGVKSVLDAGCGRGHLSRFLKGIGFDTQSCDLADASVYLERLGIPFKQCNLTKLDYEDKAFDAVVCVDVIEHLYESEIKDAISEMLRVGKHLFLRIACYTSYHGKYDKLHLTVKPPRWWRMVIEEFGDILWTTNERKGSRNHQETFSVFARAK